MSLAVNFKDIVGHVKTIERLKKIVVSGRIGHGYLFSGPEGTGKSLLVRAFAEAANCESSVGGVSCGSCRSCESFINGSTLNYMTVEPDKDGKLKIDAIREFQRLLVYKVDQGLRFAVIEGADLMAANASNVLLKTLEEPPEGYVIVLVTSRGDHLLPTILSRCQRINVGPLSSRVISDYLRDHKGLSARDSELSAKLGFGSMSAALAIADEGGLDKRNDFLLGVRGLSKKGTDHSAFIDMAEKLAKDSELTYLLDVMKSYLRDVAVIRAGSPELVVNSAIEGLYDDAADMDIDALVESFYLTEAARRSIVPPSYANKRLTLESLFTKYVEAVNN
ncbi:MAG: DNA polymerase III subunit [Deltaproteobacteria bacterium]|nr:DNA polymerase III subunit [Deltaproteobacteria bacterium]